MGKSGFCAALAAAVVCPGAPLHGVKREVVCVASSFGQARIIYEDVLDYTRGLGHDLADRSLWRLQDSQNMATLEYRPTGARVRCIGSDPKRAHGARPFLVLADEPAQWEPNKGELYTCLTRSLKERAPLTTSRPSCIYARYAKGGRDDNAHAPGDRRETQVLRYDFPLQGGARYYNQHDFELLFLGGPMPSIITITVNGKPIKVIEREFTIREENWSAYDLLDGGHIRLKTTALKILQVVDDEGKPLNAPDGTLQFVVQHKSDVVTTG